MGALALPWVVDPVRAAGENRPNLLFVLTDQWRFCTFSHGEVHDTLVQTPNLDQFVEEGARWRKAYSTYPLCTPERSILMTGRYGHQTGMMENDKMIPPGNRCLAEIFSEAGYATHYIGKTHFDGEPRSSVRLHPPMSTAAAPALNSSIQSLYAPKSGSAFTLSLSAMNSLTKTCGFEAPTM